MQLVFDAQCPRTAAPSCSASAAKLLMKNLRSVLFLPPIISRSASTMTIEREPAPLRFFDNPINIFGGNDPPH